MWNLQILYLFKKNYSLNDKLSPIPATIEVNINGDEYSSWNKNFDRFNVE